MLVPEILRYIHDLTLALDAEPWVERAEGLTTAPVVVPPATVLPPQTGSPPATKSSWRESSSRTPGTARERSSRR